eukprot:943450-Pleurochrysis_carterae.AAC.1
MVLFAAAYSTCRSQNAWDWTLGSYCWLTANINSLHVAETNADALALDAQTRGYSLCVADGAT